MTAISHAWLVYGTVGLFVAAVVFALFVTWAKNRTYRDDTVTTPTHPPLPHNLD